MTDYLALARKYRSETFEEVVGQGAIATTLTNAVRTGRIAQAYLFTGTRGVGKTTVARILAKALNCLSVEAPTSEPCNKCDACQAISRGDDIDVIEIDGASNRGIDEIRDLRANAILRPARARYKVYYIDEVHMLTREAFNALLKTLEEPPGHVKFIFSTTEPQKIPATILSRCQRFDFRNIATAEIADHLKAICTAEKIKISPDAVFRVAVAASGSMRDGISLLDQLASSTGSKLETDDVLRVLGTPGDERIASMTRAIADGDAAGALAALDEILAAGFALEGVAGALAGQFRHIMLARVCGADSGLIELSESARKITADLAGGYSVPAAVHAVSVCDQLLRNIRSSSCARALTEATVVRLAAADKFVDPASLLDRLEHLADAAPAGGAAPLRKKKALTAPAADPPPRKSPQALAPMPSLQWDGAWLGEHWSEVVAYLGRSEYADVAGLLRPAVPVAVEDGLLRLGFDARFEPMRRRAAGAPSARIAEALARLTGRSVACEFVTVEAATAGAAAVSVGPTAGPVSSEQRKAVQDDPAVRSVMDLFAGQVAGIRHDRQVPQGAVGPEAGAGDDIQDDQE